jgi:hypothetical protein
VERLLCGRQRRLGGGKVKRLIPTALNSDS